MPREEGWGLLLRDVMALERLRAAHSSSPGVIVYDMCISTDPVIGTSAWLFPSEGADAGPIWSIHRHDGYAPMSVTWPGADLYPFVRKSLPAAIGTIQRGLANLPPWKDPDDAA